MYHQEARFYQLIKQRGHLSQEDEADCLRLLTGLEGEARVAQVIQDLGLAAFYLTDLWIPLGKGTQIDGLLLMPQRLYLIEIKHYGGQFLFRDLLPDSTGGLITTTCWAKWPELRACCNNF